MDATAESLMDLALFPVVFVSAPAVEESTLADFAFCPFDVLAAFAGKLETALSLAPITGSFAFGALLAGCAALVESAAHAAVGHALKAAATRNATTAALHAVAPNPGVCVFVIILLPARQWHGQWRLCHTNVYRSGCCKSF
jgi:hypothetical protein